MAETIDYYCIPLTSVQQQSGFAPRRHYDAGNQSTYILGMGPFTLSGHGQQFELTNNNNNNINDGANSRTAATINYVKKIHPLTAVVPDKLFFSDLKIVSFCNNQLNFSQASQ